MPPGPFFRVPIAEGLQCASFHKLVDDSQILSNPIVCDRKCITRMTSLMIQNPC